MNKKDEFKKLLEEGWRIISKQISYERMKEKEKVVLKLEKAKDVMDFVVINDDNFMSHIIKYKKFSDIYGNEEFLYVENLENYQKVLDIQRKKGKAPDRPYKIMLGDLELCDCHLYHLESRPKNDLPQAYFYVRLTNNEYLINSDCRDKINIFFTDTNNLAFSGYINKVLFNDDVALFMCQGGIRRFTQERITGNVLKINPMDLLYYMGKSGGVSINIHGKKQPNFTQREFKIIFVIKDLEIDADLKINNITFTSDLDSHLFDYIKKTDALHKNPWNELRSVAVCTVISNNYYDALMQGYELIHRSVNWLQFRTDLSITGYIQNGDKKYISYIFQKSFSRFKMMPYGVVMDLISKGTIFAKVNEEIGHPLKIINNPDRYMAPLNPIINKLNAYSPHAHEQKDTFFQALNWMMFSFEEENIIDNLLQLWVSFEFLCSNIKTKKNVSKESRRKLIDYVRSLSLGSHESQRLIDVVNRANEPSLMMKWDTLLNNIGVNLSDNEKKLIKDLRRKRNDLMHGRSVHAITKDQMEKFRSVLERVLIYKIQNI